MPEPLEPPSGQDPDPPDPRLLALASIRLLRDVANQLGEGEWSAEVDELRGRVQALRRVQIRYLARLDHEKQQQS
jgi:hypothetical protein